MPLTDPMVLADITGDGRINAGDASHIARFAALIPVALFAKRFSFWSIGLPTWRRALEPWGRLRRLAVPTRG